MNLEPLTDPKCVSNIGPVTSSTRFLFWFVRRGNDAVRTTLFAGLPKSIISGKNLDELVRST
ncbi:MAG: hypothetical protein ACM3ZE_25900 [Myxococcales bacterium]